MNIVIDPGLQAYIDPLTPDEHDALERSLLAEGCRDALVLWGNVLVDGHNRYGICSKHGLPFQTVQNTRFQSMEDVHLWMIDQHLGRRSVSDFQRGTLALRKREILSTRRELARAQILAGDPSAHDTQAPTEDAADDAAPWDSGSEAPSDALSPAPVGEADVSAQAAALESKEALARVARLSASQVVMIEKIQKLATPEVVAAVKAGALSISAAAAVASLPAEEQAAAAAAGPEELKLAARRVREAKRKPKAETTPVPNEAPPANESAGAEASSEVQALQQRIRELTEENEALHAEIATLKKRYAL